MPLGPVSIAFSSSQANSTFECSLDGGAYRACRSADPLSVTPGPHTFSVRAIGPNGLTDGTPAAASWASVAPRLDLCGDVTQSRTLSPDYASVFVLTCDVTVAPGATLTLGAGALLKGDGGAHLYVHGTLDAQGTAASPIDVTSSRDDTVGGDTNGDGSATGPLRGDWGGISAYPAGGNTTPHLSARSRPSATRHWPSPRARPPPRSPNSHVSRTPPATGSAWTPRSACRR